MGSRQLSRVEWLAADFYFVSSLGVALWWTLIFQIPWMQRRFFGPVYDAEFTRIFFLADAVMLVACGLTAFVLLVGQGRRPARICAWIVFGAYAYAFLETISLAIRYPDAYNGLVLMMLGAGTALIFAIGLEGLSLLWGPFRFRTAPQRPEEHNLVASILQTATMWFTFLVVIPGVVAALEGYFRWTKHWIVVPMAIPAALFVSGAIVGISAMAAMVRAGGGTPLPAACAPKLVVSGIYRFTRNPMAWSGILQGVAIGVWLGSPLIIVYALLGGIAWDIIVRPEEEADLLARFGSDYEKYRDAVPCWWFRP